MHYAIEGPHKYSNTNVCDVCVCSPNSRSISWLALIRVSDTPAISSDVMKDPDITLTTATPRLSVSVETASHIPQHPQRCLPLKRGQKVKEYLGNRALNPFRLC